MPAGTAWLDIFKLHKQLISFQPEVHKYSIIYHYYNLIDFAMHSIEISNSEPVPSILLANAYFIHQFSLDSTREQTVVSEPRGGIWGIDYHYR